MADTAQSLRFLEKHLERGCLNNFEFNLLHSLWPDNPMWNSQHVKTSDTGVINKPIYKALWLWNESRCQAVPKMKSQRLIQHLSEQIILSSFLSLSCRCSKISACSSNGLNKKQEYESHMNQRHYTICFKNIKDRTI